MPLMPMIKDSNQRATTDKNPGQYRNQCSQLKLDKQQAEGSNANVRNNSGANNLHTNNRNKNNRIDRKPMSVSSPCETCGKTSHSTEKNYFRFNAANRSPSQKRRQAGQREVQEKKADKIAIESNERAQH